MQMVGVGVQKCPDKQTRIRVQKATTAHTQLSSLSLEGLTLRDVPTHPLQYRSGHSSTGTWWVTVGQ